MFDLLGLSRRHDLREWRDTYAFAAATALNEAAVALMRKADERIAKASIREITLSPRAFIKRDIAPLVEEAALGVQASLFQKAEQDYLKIIGEEIVWHRSPWSSHGDLPAFHGWKDVASAAAPLAVGGGVAAALPFTAITTSTAFFGLVTTTAVSWPILIGGTAIAGVALGTGALNSAQISDKLRARLRRLVREHIQRLFFEDGRDGKAVLTQIAAQLDRLVAEGKKR